MSRSSFDLGTSDTPWWHETPSLASQSTYSQSVFAGASISQLTNPFSTSSERTPLDVGSQSEGDDSDQEGQRSFLIPSIDTNTGQSLGTTVFDGGLGEVQKQVTNGQSLYSASNTGNIGSFQTRLQPFSDSSNQQPRMSSSLPRSMQAFQSGSLTAKSTAKENQTRSKDVESISSKQGKSLTWRGGGKSKKNKKEEREVLPADQDASSNGVFNVTLKCQIHLHSENGDLKRSSSNIELVPSSGPGPTIVLPASVTMAPGLNPDPMTLHSTITEEDSNEFSGLLNDYAPSCGDDVRDNLTPLSLSSDESQLSHSMSSANQDILNYLRPQFMQYLNPDAIAPMLTQQNLLTNEDVKFISHPLKSDKEKRKRILASAPARDFDVFVECISSEKSDSGHVYLARRLREAIEKKRNNPFKRLSSLRGKGRGVSSENKPTPLSLAKDRYSPHGSTTPSPRTPTKLTKKNTTSKANTGEFSFHPILESVPLDSEENDHFVYESSTLPRHFESKSKQVSRGTKPYSSARYTSTTSPMRELQSRRSKLARHGSFQGSSDGRVQVTPLLRDPNKLSQENSDVLENLAHFKTTTFHFPPTSQEVNEFSYQNMMKESHDPAFSNSQIGMGMELAGERDSVRRGKKISDPIPFTTITEDVSETTESPDIPPPSLPVKKRRSFSTSDSKKRYTPIAVTRFSSNATPSELTRRQQTTPTPSNESSDQKNLDGMDGTPRHTSLRRQSPKRTAPLKRGSSMYGVMDSPSRQYPLTKYDGSYMPPALSPLPTSTDSPAEEQPPPIPVKQRSHRRAQSCDTSQASMDFVSLPTPHHTRPSNYKHHTLKHETTPSSMSIHSNSSRLEVPTNVPIISSQDSGITSTFDKSAQSVSSYSLCTDPGSSVSKYSGASASEPGREVLRAKRFEWLQEKVRFKKTPEDIMFASRTHFNQERMILNSGVLYERGHPKFVVLLTDMLLIIKPRKKGSTLPGRLGKLFSSSHGPVLDWFSDLECVAKMPLMLHHLSVRALSKKKEPQVLYLHYDDDSEMTQLTLHSVSKEAKDIWVDSLNSAIVACTRAQASTVLPVGNHIRMEPTSSTYTKLTLTIVEANNVAVEVDAKTRNHFCSVQLGDKRCKTPSVEAQCWPTWDYKFEFVDFSLTEIVYIEFYTERITSPDEYLGGVDIQLMAVAQRLKVNMSQGVSTLQLKNQHLPLKNGKGTLTLDFELGWITKDNEE